MCLYFLSFKHYKYDIKFYYSCKFNFTKYRIFLCTVIIKRVCHLSEIEEEKRIKRYTLLVDKIWNTWQYEKRLDLGEGYEIENKEVTVLYGDSLEVFTDTVNTL